MNINTAEEFRDKGYFSAFCDARIGDFDGFQMIETFHKVYDKYDAYHIDYANDSSEVEYNGNIFNVGADDVVVYFMTTTATPDSCKMVHFNRSVYVF